MQLTDRQKKIAEIVKEDGPITGADIAGRLRVTRSALRGDLAVLMTVGVIDARRKFGYYYLGDWEENPASVEISRACVSDYLSMPVIVSPDANAYDAAVLLFTEDIGTVFVGENNEMLGIVSRKDLLRAAMGREDMQRMPISMIMTPKSKIIYAEPDEDMVSVAQKLIDYEIDCLPVVTVNEKHGEKCYTLLGRVSKTNITRLFMELGLGSRRK